jgi:talin
MSRILVGASDHGLFCPGLGKWLTNSKTLDFYDLKSGDLIEYKKKHRPLRVKMMDDTIKTILIDESAMVQDLVVMVCQRIGIANFEEYSFQAETEVNPVGTIKEKKLKKVVAESDEGILLFKEIKYVYG